MSTAASNIVYQTPRLKHSVVEILRNVEDKKNLLVKHSMDSILSTVEDKHSTSSPFEQSSTSAASNIDRSLSEIIQYRTKSVDLQPPSLIPLFINGYEGLSSYQAGSCAYKLDQITQSRNSYVNNSSSRCPTRYFPNVDNEAFTSQEKRSFWSPLDTPSTAISYRDRCELQRSAATLNRGTLFDASYVTKYREPHRLRYTCSRLSLASCFPSSCDTSTDRNNNSSVKEAHNNIGGMQPTSQSWRTFSPIVLSASPTVESQEIQAISATINAAQRFNSGTPLQKITGNGSALIQTGSLPPYVAAQKKSTTMIKCVKCKKSFTCQASLRRHMMIHDDALFACEHCDARYTRQDSVVRHQRKCHPSH